MISLKINSSTSSDTLSVHERRTAYEPRRPLKELNLLDRFLFDEAMEDPENVKTILDIILSQNTSLKHPSQTENIDRKQTDPPGCI